MAGLGLTTERVDVTQLTPLLFLERSADVFPDKVAITYGETHTTYSEMADATQAAAAGLAAVGVGQGDRVAYLMPNLPEMLIGHFAVPLLGAVLVAINTRLAGAEIAYILDHSGSRVLVADTALLPAVIPHLESCPGLELVVQLADEAPVMDLDSATVAYAEMVAEGGGTRRPWRVDDELSPISIYYTSGTTGRPKGVQYTHRGAHLNSLAELLHSEHSPDSVYLWTLPMFHCNGWCTTWAITAFGGRHVCLRDVDPAEIWRLIGAEGVTHLNGAPTVLVSLANSLEAAPFGRPFTITTAGAPPSPTIIGAMERLGARMIHVYGLTETYGPYT
ncbi:MAG: AMP-binding protein, partial [Acidimicrobiia bacterium]